MTYTCRHDPPIRARLRGAGAAWANTRRRGSPKDRHDALEWLTDLVYLATLDGVPLEVIALDTDLPPPEVTHLLRHRDTCTPNRPTSNTAAPGAVSTHGGRHRRI